ncbi:protein adenylyltransferase SelO [sulfur-oxidizing endosymbiont of Gigantopelta aegis]|uniref:protein adenylyltransferase SelO n=1 Tax=sulfur-oxidizing endosymbiont of Gigantopelta aegis TaxID=2794934 RepID=UPI0018DC98F4|nr:YdiU family protein [sulfur-oxidizing endosymbiont of Gigantopelta aegis]
MFNFDNSYTTLAEDFYQAIMPSSAVAPQLIAFNTRLANELGIDYDGIDEQSLANIFSGKTILPGSKPISQAYAGHQFGNFVPSLGDGRAILLGEIITPKGLRVDVQLKGAGKTPFSRGGDGRSALGPVIREYIVSEAMHALNIPTTRALAAVTSGEQVYRDNSYQNNLVPGGILTRIASSHIRVGTFEYFASRQEYANVKQLADYAIKRHYPELLGQENIYLAFFRAVAKRKLSLVAKWMSVGFIHGVMNTDNNSISGETLDFGPCAFMDQFSEQKVFSSIDRNSRYAYSNQANIALWNISSLANCLVPIMGIEPDDVSALFDQEFEILSDYSKTVWAQAMGNKLGIFSATQEDLGLINNWLHYLENENLDFTNSFHDLAAVLHQNSAQTDDKINTKLKTSKEFEQFLSAWKNRLQQQSQDIEASESLMQQHNPLFIPRNHQVEKAIVQAMEGNYKHFHRLNHVLGTPFTEQEAHQDLKAPPKEDEIVQQTFCGT